jgi:tetratricopeptide (TPR) repeat protein
MLAGRYCVSFGEVIRTGMRLLNMQKLAQHKMGAYGGSAMLKKRRILPLCLLALANITLSWTAVIAADHIGDEEVSQAQEAQEEGDQASAENKYLEAIEKFRSSKRDLPLSWALRNLGDIYTQQNKLTEAADSYNNAWKIRNNVLVRGTDDNNVSISSLNRKMLEKDTALIMVALGSVYTRQKDFTKAQSTLSDALSRVKTSWGPEHDCTGVALAAIGDLRFAQGKYAEAESYYKQAMAIRSKYHPLKELGVLVANYTSVLKTLKKNKEANQLEVKTRTKSN